MTTTIIFAVVFGFFMGACTTALLFLFRKCETWEDDDYPQWFQWERVITSDEDVYLSKYHRPYSDN